MTHRTISRRGRLAAAALGLVAGAACTSYPPLPTVDAVDLPAFMGDWYVVGHIPASSEAEAFNGVERYELRDDGRIDTTYTFRDGGFDGPLEITELTGIVRDEQTNATWDMRWFWPFDFEYLVTYLADDGSATIIARTKRDYAWIMTREPDISDERYAELVAKLAEQGYDVSLVRRVPHRWPDPEHPADARR